MANSRFTIEAVFKAIDKITAPVTRMQNRMGKFTRSVGGSLKTLNRGADKLVGGFKRVAIGLTAALAVTGVAMADVVKTGAEFELNIIRALSKTETGLKKGSAGFKAITKDVRDLAKATEFTAGQSSEAFNTLITAGFKAESAIATLPTVMDLATVAQIELNEAARIGIKTMGAFGLKTKDPIQKQKNLVMVSDLLAKASTSATFTIEDLFLAIADGAATMRKAEIGMVDTVTLFGALADSAIDAGKAGNAMKRFALAISAPASLGARALRHLKIETTEMIDGVERTRNVLAILKDLKVALRDIAPAKQPAILDAIFGKRTITSAAILIDDTGDSLDSLRKKMGDYTGTLKRMSAETRMATAIRLKRFGSAVTELKLKIFDAVEGPLNSMIDSMLKWFDVNDKVIAQNISDFVKGFGENWTLIKKLSIAFVAVVVAVGALIVALKVLIGVMTVVNLVVAANPIGLIATAIALVILSILAAIVVVVFFRKELLAWWDSLGLGTKIILGFIGGPLFALTVMASKIIEAWEPLRIFFDNLGEIISAVTVDLAKAAAIGGKLALNPFSIFSNANGNGLDGDESRADTTPSVVSPSERISRSIEEKRSTQSSEVVIRDETGRAEISNKAIGFGLKLMQTGAFQ